MSLDGDRPRLMRKADVAAYCGVTVDALSKWIARRIVPAPLKGTHRWDRVALDRALDRLSGIASAPEPEANPFEEWDRRRAERKAARQR